MASSSCGGNVPRDCRSGSASMKAAAWKRNCVVSSSRFSSRHIVLSVERAASSCCAASAAWSGSTRATTSAAERAVASAICTDPAHRFSISRSSSRAMRL
eukprot:scaffold137723_cov32-Tisochrysis_lutea.AAC.2